MDRYFWKNFDLKDCSEYTEKKKTYSIEKSITFQNFIEKYCLYFMKWLTLKTNYRAQLNAIQMNDKDGKGY
jgi:hypothetical protein